MVRQVTEARTPGWKGMLGVLVAAAAILWHMLACTESPMAFSPSGEQLAFVTMEPFGVEQVSRKGSHVYRLMVVKGGRRLRVMEEATDHMLSAPAYSPDGKQLCYLRIQLFTEQQLKRLEQRAQKRRALWDQATSGEGAATAPAPRRSLPGAAGEPGKEPETQDRSLPRAGATMEALAKIAVNDPLPAELVVRDAKTDAVLSATPLQIPIDRYNDEAFALLYMLLRPQYAPDGKWIYFCASQAAIAVNWREGKQRILAAPAGFASLSPDGKTLATVQPEAIGFIRTDGQTATYRRWKKSLSPAGVVWKDNRTLVVLSAEKDKPVELNYLKTDGTLAAAKTLKPLGEAPDDVFAALALAPDGRRMVIATGSEVRFLRADGKVLNTWTDGEETLLLFSPTFTPDSKRVAFKLLVKEDNQAHCGLILFFTPEGKELARVEVPPVRPGQTRPASRPATTPAAGD